MCDILLIQPPIRDFYLTAKRTIPYGLASIAGALVREGFSVDIFDGLATRKARAIPLPAELEYLGEFYRGPDISPFNLFHRFTHFGYSFDHIGQVAKKSGAFLVGISSLFTAYAEEALQTATAVKKAHPGCSVVFGGHHPTAMPEHVMECAAADYVLRGEGEVSMPALATALSCKKPLENVPGVVFRKTDRTLHISPPASMERLDDYPPPSIHLVKHAFYKRRGKGGAVVATSRGCPLKCGYCCFGGSTPPYRQRSVASVVREIETWITRHDAGFIDFEDENLTMNKRRFLSLMEAFKARFGNTGIELRAMNGLFPPSLDDDTVRTMAKAGFKTLNLSVGSVSPEQLRRFNRPDVGQATENALNLAERYGMDAVCYVIAGSPWQDPESSVDDLLWLAGKKTLAGVSIFYPAPGSVDFDTCKTLGLLPDSCSKMRSTAIPISHTTARIESATILRLGRILNFMKSLKDREGSVSLALEKTKTGISGDRIQMGKRLLKQFLNDGIIRGATPEGKIHEHKTSLRLTTRFINGIEKISIPVIKN